jgi:hypothetical protein
MEPIHWRRCHTALLVDKFSQVVDRALHHRQDLAQMTAIETHEAALALKAGCRRECVFEGFGTLWWGIRDVWCTLPPRNLAGTTWSLRCHIAHSLFRQPLLKGLGGLLPSATSAVNSIELAKGPLRPTAVLD